MVVHGEAEGGTEKDLRVSEYLADRLASGRTLQAIVLLQEVVLDVCLRLPEIAMVRRVSRNAQLLHSTEISKPVI